VPSDLLVIVEDSSIVGVLGRTENTSRKWSLNTRMSVTTMLWSSRSRIVNTRHEYDAFIKGPRGPEKQPLTTALVVVHGKSENEINELHILLRLLVTSSTPNTGRNDRAIAYCINQGSAGSKVDATDPAAARGTDVQGGWNSEQYRASPSGCSPRGQRPQAVQGNAYRARGGVVACWIFGAYGRFDSLVRVLAEVVPPSS